MPKQNLEACRLNAINNAEDDIKIIVDFPLQHENWNGVEMRQRGKDIHISHRK